MNKKIQKRILIPCYVQFAMCILFWVMAGTGLLKVNLLISVFMILMTTICAIVILTVIIYDRLYYDAIHESFKNLEDLNFKLRSQRHEYLNELQVVYGLLEIGEYREAINYLKPVYTDIAKVSKALRTSKPAVNALLQAKLAKADSMNVELFIEVSSNLSGINMAQWDLCKVLANIIDNAITAVDNNDKSDDKRDKKVWVNISEDENNYRFCIYNNGPQISENKYDQIFKKGYTSKTGEGHGFVLSIVKDIVTASKGSIKVTSDYVKTSFDIVIPK